VARTIVHGDEHLQIKDYR